jgi:hypothetical protein
MKEIRRGKASDGQENVSIETRIIDNGVGNSER